MWHMALYTTTSYIFLQHGFRDSVGLVDEFNSECTDSQLNAEHWFVRIKKLYN